MSCVLRVSVPDIEVALKRLSIVPYRVEKGTAYFIVSEADFSDFDAQINDAIAFLSSNGTDVKMLMSNLNVSGEIDFAVEWRDVVLQSDTLPPALVRLAGEYGLALILSHYPASKEGKAAA